MAGSTANYLLMLPSLLIATLTVVLMMYLYFTGPKGWGRVKTSVAAGVVFAAGTFATMFVPLWLATPPSVVGEMVPLLVCFALAAGVFGGTLNLGLSYLATDFWQRAQDWGFDRMRQSSKRKPR